MADDTRNNKAVRHEVGYKYKSPNPSHTVCYLVTLCAFRTQGIRPNFEDFLTPPHRSAIGKY